MTALLILIPAALMLGAVGLIAFLWSVKSGQFDDLDGAAVRILDEPDVVPPAAAKAEAVSPPETSDRR